MTQFAIGCAVGRIFLVIHRHLAKPGASDESDSAPNHKVSNLLRLGAILCTCTSSCAVDIVPLKDFHSILDEAMSSCLRALAIARLARHNGHVSGWARGLCQTGTSRKQGQNEDPEEPRNMCGIQMLSDSMWQQIFGKEDPESRSVGANARNIRAAAVSQRPRRRHASAEANVGMPVAEKVDRHLSAFGLLGQPSQSVPTPPDFQLPLLGKDIVEHWEVVGAEAAEPYLSLAKEHADSLLPPQPTEWVLQEGWTRYSSDGSTEAIDYPDEAVLVFDVETCVRDGDFPTLAVAASPSAWYGWCSKRLCDPSEPADELISLEASGREPQLVIGHFVR